MTLPLPLLCFRCARSAIHHPANIFLRSDASDTIDLSAFGGVIPLKPGIPFDIKSAGMLAEAVGWVLNDKRLGLWSYSGDLLLGRNAQWAIIPITQVNGTLCCERHLEGRP